MRSAAPLRSPVSITVRFTPSFFAAESASAARFFGWSVSFTAPA